MAEERIVTNIVANADFSNLIADVQKVVASLARMQESLDSSNKMLQKQIAGMNSAFAATLRSTGQFTTHTVSLSSSIEKFGKNLDSGKLKLNQYFNAYQQHVKTSGGLIRELAKQQTALQNSIVQPIGRNAEGLMKFYVNVPRGIDEIKSKSALARQELQIMNKVIQQGANQLINWGKNTQWAGRQLTVGLTVPMAAFGKAASDAFRQADQELTRLTKVYGGLAAPTQKQLASIRKDVSQTANELAKAYGTSYTETIALAADIAATGKEGNDLLKSTQETTRLAVLGEVDKQTAMKATLALQTAFKQNTEQLTESINFLNAVENQTSTTLGDLIEAIPKAGPIIEGLGGSVKDLALYLTAMKEGGVNATEGANALKSALGSLINPTKVATDMFAGFGINLKGIVTENAGDLTQTLLTLQSALDKLNPLQKQQALEQLFGKFQFARMNALFENLGRQGSQTLQVLDLMKASSQDLANVAGRELAQVTESASGRYRRALEGLKADLAGVGEQFLNIQTTLINLVDKVIGFANHLPKPLKQLLTLVGGLTAVAGPLIMLTGVLANFFGYIVKGISHMRAFFRGGEGWKYLTPEMIAAEKAGNLVEQTFYNDAKAAAVLKTALAALIDEFTVLEQKIKTGEISVAPTLQTIAGNTITPGGVPLIVDPNHPLAGEKGARASTHMVPRSMLSEEQRMQQTMFGLVPGPIPVNRKLKDNPQIYMSGKLPSVEGLTTIGGVSTGIVGTEAAKWHAMQAALGMQSKQELANLKKELALTGMLTEEFLMSYETILPQITKIIDGATAESAAIVSQLRAGKINLDQARQQIIALNLKIEQDLAATAVASAAGMGRTLNPTMVPTLNQPVVDATGKSNMRELFKKGKTRQFINSIAESLGVRTWGAGYSTETTRPKKFALGGAVYMSGAGEVLSHPGSPKGTDTIPAWLSEGEFVLRKKAVEVLGVPLLQELNALDINKARGPVGAHASLSMPALAHELPDMYGQYLPKGTEAFAKALPDHPVEVFDSNILGLFSEENQALRRGHRGLTRLELIRALAAPNKRLFKYLPGLTLQQQITFKKRLLENARRLPEGRLYHDDALAQIYNFAKKDTLRTLAASEQASFKETMLLANRPKGFRPASFGMYTEGQQLPVMSAYEARVASGNDPFFYMSPKSASGKSGKTTAIITDALGNKQSITTSGSKMFKAGIRTDPQFAGRLNIGRVVTPYAQKMLRMAWRRGYANGGYVGSGGPQGVQYKGLGGLIAPLAIGLGGNMLGGMIGGGLGSAISMGSNLLPFLMMGNSALARGAAAESPRGPSLIASKLGSMNVPGTDMPITKPIFSTQLAKTESLMGRLAEKSGFAAKGAGALVRGLSGILKLTSPLGIGITAASVAIGLFVNHMKEVNEQHRVARLGFGMTAESAKKAGFQYTDYNKRVKDLLDNLKATSERNKMVYESMTQAGVPMKMTIEQYKKLKETVKSTLGDYIKLFNQTKNGDVGKVAIQLKAQFMAAGDSAEEATAKIYTLIQESNKAGMARDAISTKAFQNIQTVQDAASAATKTFEAALKVSDAKGQVDALLGTFAALDAATQKAIDDSVKKSKKDGSAVLTTYEAADQVLEKVNTQYTKQSKLTQSLITELGKVNPELAMILNTSDTLTTAWEKLRILADGINLNVAALSGPATDAAYSISKSVMAAVKSNSVVAEQQKKYDDLQTAIKGAEKAANGMSAKQQIDSRKVSEGLQKQIDLIKKTAQQKLDAIRKQTDAENAQLEIQKEQIAAQQALASGDMSGYAQSQLNIQQLTNTQQQKLAENAITSQAELDIKPLQDQLNAVAEKNQAVADASALAADKLKSLQDKAKKVGDNLTTLTENLTNIAFKIKTLGSDFTGSQEYKDAMKALEKLGITADPEKVLKDIVNGLGNIKTDLINVYLAGGGQVASYGSGGTASDPISLGKASSINPTLSGELHGWRTTWGSQSVSQRVKNLAQQKGIQAGSYFSLQDDMGKTYIFRVREDGNITMVKDPYSKASGGYISGAGTGTSDSIPAMLSNGEYVVKASAVKSIGIQTLNGINKMASGGPVYSIPGSMGSPQSSSGVVSGSYNNNTYNFQIALSGTNITPDDMFREISKRMQLMNAKAGGRARSVGGTMNINNAYIGVA